MSANIEAVCASFKQEFLEGIHNLSSGGDTLKAALYYQNSGLGYATTVYSSTGEVSGAGYTAGGLTVTNGVSPAISGQTAFWTPSASLSWSGLTIASLFDCWLLYNVSKANRAIAVFTFPAKTVSSSVFVINMPSNAAATALLQAA